MANIINTFKRRKNLYAFMFVVLISLFAFQFIRKSFSLLEPIKSVEIYSSNVSYSNNDPGAWKVTKSASWTGVGKARITVDVDTVLKTPDTTYKDIIMVLDISGSMNGEKLSRVKSDSIELINSVLSNSNNKMALISFESSSTLISSLTNDKNTLISYINNLTDTGCTNYYRALKNVGTILENYTKQNNRECIVMFLTDGYPNEETPNQIGEYQYLKDTYSYVTFNGIQYEMGDTVLEPIKEISDNQWIADMETLNNVLFDASVAPLTYDEFNFTDYIDTNFFNIASIDNIKTKVGTTSLDGNKVTWTINNGLKSGDNATLTIDVTLKNEYLNVVGTYPTNQREEVISKINGNDNEDVNSNLTPILQDNYVVIYDGNAPSDCTVSNVPNTVSRSVFTNVEVSNNKPICSGYQFKGWQIITEGVEKVNDDYFIMPESDVILRAEWSKLALTKSVNGEVAKVQTLYNIMKEQAVMDNIQSDYVSSSTGIDFTSNNSNTNGKGVYERKGTENDTNPIYYYRGEVEDNNVIFAGFCWKMVITTDTGGVKMIYNGVPTDGKCNNTRTNTQIGAKSFNSNHSSLADVGYMYGTRYAYSLYSSWNQFFGKTTTSKTILTKQTGVGSTNYYYADYAVWNGTEYVLYNSDDLTDTTADPVTQYTWSSNYNNLKGKYTCGNATSTTCTTVRYISGGTNSYMYYVLLAANSSIDNYRLASNTVSYTAGVGYTLTNPVNVAKVVNGNSWFNQYSNYKGYYFCGDTGTNELNTTTCDTVYYVNSGSVYQAFIVSLTGGETYESLANQELLFGNSVDSSGNLTNTIPIKYSNWSSTGYKAINNNHYTCFNTTGTCSSNVYYVYYTSSSYVYFITLPIGKTIDVALSEMLDHNDNPSTIMGAKTNPETNTVNYWYYNNIETKNDTNGNSFSDYIEDTIYCNDRSFNNYAESGWNPDGGDTTKYLYFGSYGRTLNPSVTCPRNIDKLTVASGYLKYPTGLLTEDEIRLAGASSSTNYNYYLWNGTPGSNSSSTATYWWSASPISFSLDSSLEWGVNDRGSLDSDFVNDSRGVRPVVSLKPGTRTVSGDGSRDDPWIIETRE